MATAYLGIGSNIGDREHYFEVALGLLDLPNRKVKILDCSSVFETDPVGGPPQAPYLNGVVKIKTSLSPQKLLRYLKKIEKGMGRAKTVRNGPRIIDLDILLYDDIVLKDPDLVIPHPRMFERDFVLNPLQELLPNISGILAYAHN